MEDSYSGIQIFVEEVTSFSLRRKNDEIKSFPEYSPSRLISYSVFKVIGQANIIFMIFHIKNVCPKADTKSNVYTSDGCSALLGSVNLTT